MKLPFSSSARGLPRACAAPDWTRTELGGPNAHNGVEEAITATRGIIDRLTFADTGSYWNFEGERLPW